MEGKKMNRLGKPMAVMIQEIIKMRKDLKKAHSDTKILNGRLEKLENQQAKINFDIEEINFLVLSLVKRMEMLSHGKKRMDDGEKLQFN